MGPCLRLVFRAMSRLTSCPDVVHLRLLFEKPAAAPDAESLRAHLGQCADCRAIVAGFRVVSVNAGTLADEPEVPAVREPSSLHTLQVFRKNNIAAGQAGGPMPADSVADVVTMDDSFALGARGHLAASSTAGNSAMAISTSDATMFVPVGKAAHDSLQVSDSAYLENSPPVSASSETCYAPLGQGPSTASGSDTAFPVTKYDFGDAALPRDPARGRDGSGLRHPRRAWPGGHGRGLQGPSSAAPATGRAQNGIGGGTRRAGWSGTVSCRSRSRRQTASSQYRADFRDRRIRRAARSFRSSMSKEAVSTSRSTRTRPVRGEPPSSWRRWRAPWRSLTSAGLSIATSNRRISSWPRSTVSRRCNGRGISIRRPCPMITGQEPLSPKSPILVWPNAPTTIPAKPKAAPSSAPPAIWRRNRRGERPGKLARPSTSMPSARSSTSFW